MRKTGSKWDSVPYDGITVEMLDQESFDIFRREALRTNRLSQEDLDCSNEELLDKMGLLVDGKLKRAAILLFYRHPERLSLMRLSIRNGRRVIRYRLRFVIMRYLSAIPVLFRKDGQLRTF